MNNYPPEYDNSTSAPPRLLLWLTVIFLIVLVLAAIAVVVFIANDRRISGLIPVVGIGLIVLPIASVISALFMRNGLPKRLWLWLAILWAVFLLVISFGFTLYYRDSLPPRYQEEMLTYAPFMRQFMRPTPQGGIVPTSAVTSAISPADLLALPIEATASLAPTETSIQPDETPTSEPTMQVTDAPTEAAIVPTITNEAPVIQPTSEPANASNINTSFVSSNRPASAFMYGFRWERQGWNNCGPTNITMALSHFGWQEDQNYAAQFLKPETEDKNVSPGEMVNFVNTQTGVRAITRIGGSVELLKHLIAANFPVITETTFTPEGSDWIGHYQTVVGYDDNAGSFYVYDSWLGIEDGNGLPEPYGQFDRDWQAFNRTFIVLYEQSREGVLIDLLGDLADVALAAEHALEVAQQEASQDPTNPFAWFNIGTALTRLERYDQAASAYDEATRRLLPFRMLWYQFGPFEAYFNVGRYDDVMGLVQNNLTNGAQFVEETYYWQGRVFEARGQTNEAIAAYTRALSHNPLYQAAQDALNNLT